MRIELKHLAPYLPYDLYFNRFEYKCIDKTTNPVTYSKEKYPVKTQLNCVTLNGFNYKENKLLLKSMKSLSNEDVVRLKLFVDADKQYLIDNPLNCCYDDLQYLLSKHYDVFGFIDAGFAKEIKQ